MFFGSLLINDVFVDYINYHEITNNVFGDYGEIMKQRIMVL